MSTLKSAVFVVLVLFALIPLNNAACWHQQLKLGATHCQDDVDKTWHAMGSSWTNSKCQQCVCDTLKSCCEGLPTSVFISDDCTVEHDYNTCTYKVVKKSDRNTECTYSAIGK